MFQCLFDDAVAAQKGVDGGLAATEATVEHGGILCTAAGEDVVLERIGGFFVEDSVGLEH